MRSSISWMTRFSVAASVLTAVGLGASWVGSRGGLNGAEEPSAGAAKPVIGARDPALGRRIPSLVLKNAAGQPVGLYDFHEANYLAVVFITNSCPISNQYLPILNELQAKYRDQKVQFLGVNSHPGESAEKIARHSEEFGVTFPVLCDPDQAAADVLGASRTGEVFVLDPQKFVRYRGRIDDRITYGAKRDEPTRHDLASALDELLSGKPVTVASTDVAGCRLNRTRRVPPKGEITWSGQVASIVENKCAGCHHPKTAAPFSLQSYEETKNWGEMIREVVQQRRMPPWHADPRFGDFVDDRKLTQVELDTLLAWIDDGMPAGDLSQVPAPKEYTDGWRIGTPDVVFEIPEEVTVPAKGVVPYLYFETPTNFKEEMWLQAAEARPGNRSAVHHIILYYKDPANKKGNFKDNWLDGSAPGNTPLMFPVGIGRRIPAGATLVWEMHYTATGKEEKDRSQYGLKFHKEKPAREAHMMAVMNSRFRIPPGDPNHKVVSKMTMPFNAEVLAYAPHMHLRGKDFEYKAIFPDGRSEILMSMPQYDFNWQTGYGVKKPVRLPRGTVLECTAHFDNSPGNPNNPDPTQEVRWGDQTWQEMMIGFIDVVPAE